MRIEDFFSFLDHSVSQDFAQIPSNQAQKEIATDQKGEAMSTKNRASITKKIRKSVRYDKLLACNILLTNT